MKQLKMITFLYLTSLCICRTDSLVCFECRHIEKLPGEDVPDVAGLEHLLALMKDESCKTGQDIFRIEICGRPESGKKAVCIGFNLTVSGNTVYQGDIDRFQYLFYFRGCHELEMDLYPYNHGNLTVDNIRHSLQETVSHIDRNLNTTTTVDTVTGPGTYCTQDLCGASTATSDFLAGMGGRLPSLVFTTMLAGIVTVS